LYLFTHTGVQHEFISDDVRVNSKTTGVTSRTGTANPSGFRYVHVARSVVFCVVFCRSSFVLSFLYFWLPLWYL